MQQTQSLTSLNFGKGILDFAFFPCRFSGVTEEDLENVTISLRDVQAVLLSMFSAETILIGHSLESDLLALKVAWFLISRASIQCYHLPSPAVNPVHLHKTS